MTKRKRSDEDLYIPAPTNKGRFVPRGSFRASSDSNCGSSGGSNENSRHMVKELTRAIIPQLDARAAHYGLLSNFTQGIRDAQWIIDACPIMAMGYLRLGSLYLMQGKSALAVATYDRGLAQVLPYTTQLAMARAAAIKQLVRWIDPVAKLPYDLLKIIFDQLSMSDRVESTHVSRRWQSCLVDQFDHLWQNVSLETKHMEPMIPLISRHIRTLDMHTLPPQRAQFVWNLITSGQFVQLKSLTLDVLLLTTTTFAPPMPNITFLKIHHSIPPTSLFVESLLISCPNLSWLSLNNGTKLPSRKWTRLPRNLKLQSLSVHSEKIGIQYRDMEAILRRSPDLRQLYLHTCCDPEIMHIVDRWCPRLENLELNTLGTVTDGMPIRTFDDSDNHGLKRLAMVVRKKSLNLKPCILRPTLTSLYIDLNDNNLTTGMIDMLMGFDSSHLVDLGLGGFEGAFVYLLLTQCSVRGGGDGGDRATLLPPPVSLKHLRLFNTMLSENIFAGVIRHYPPNHLKSLVLQDCDALTHNNLLPKLLNHSQRSLERVVFERISNVGDGVLDAIGYLSYLRELTLDGAFSAPAMRQFGHKLKHLPRLEKVELRNLEVITDETLEALAEVPTLREVEMSGIENITDYGMVVLLDKKAKYLHSLVVRSCNQLTSAMLRRIHHLFPLSPSSLS